MSSGPHPEILSTRCPSATFTHRSAYTRQHSLCRHQTPSTLSPRAPYCPLICTETNPNSFTTDPNSYGCQPPRALSNISAISNAPGAGGSLNPTVIPVMQTSTFANGSVDMSELNSPNPSAAALTQLQQQQQTGHLFTDHHPQQQPPLLQQQNYPPHAYQQQQPQFVGSKFDSHPYDGPINFRALFWVDRGPNIWLLQTTIAVICLFEALLMQYLTYKVSSCCPAVRPSVCPTV